jgi:hypothetical protein
VDTSWNDGKGLYNVYRETIDLGTVESVSVWCDNLPPGQQARCVIGPVKGLPMATCTVSPAVTINGQTVVFPAEMPSRRYLGLNSSNDCMLYGPKGEVITNLSPEGSVPLLRAGKNQVQFSCTAPDGPAPRVRLTVASHGQPLWCSYFLLFRAKRV